MPSLLAAYALLQWLAGDKRDRSNVAIPAGSEASATLTSISDLWPEVEECKKYSSSCLSIEPT